MNMNTFSLDSLMMLAYVAAGQSPDPSNQNGAALYHPSKAHPIFGNNDFPEGIAATPELLSDRDRKLAYIEHAERSVIYAAARAGYPTNGSVMICPWVACEACARAIAMAGVVKLVAHKERMDTTPERWKESVARGDEILASAGVKRVYVEGSIKGAPRILVNGQPWQP